jgi:hypothetical protein
MYYRAVSCQSIVSRIHHIEYVHTQIAENGGTPPPVWKIYEALFSPEAIAKRAAREVNRPADRRLVVRGAKYLIAQYSHRIQDYICRHHDGSVYKFMTKFELRTSSYPNMRQPRYRGRRRITA